MTDGVAMPSKYMTVERVMKDLREADPLLLQALGDAIYFMGAWREQGNLMKDQRDALTGRVRESLLDVITP